MAYRGTISILHGELKKLTSACPRDVRGLGRALRRICERTPALSLEIPPRGDEREIILTLRKNVGNDGNVGNDAPDPEDPTEWVDLDSEEDE
jgi:hypothetical protein